MDAFSASSKTLIGVFSNIGFKSNIFETVHDYNLYPLTLTMSSLTSSYSLVQWLQFLVTGVFGKKKTYFAFPIFECESTGCLLILFQQMVLFVLFCFWGGYDMICDTKLIFLHNDGLCYEEHKFVYESVSQRSR